MSLFKPLRRSEEGRNHSSNAALDINTPELTVNLLPSPRSNKKERNSQTPSRRITSTQLPIPLSPRTIDDKQNKTKSRH